MGVSGSHGPLGGGAPLPDPERVATLRFTIIDDPETCATFGEAPRARLAELNDRALAETRSGDLGECSALLAHARDRVSGLDPRRLQPRGGLAGLFDSRGKRLKAFRAAYLSTASAVGDVGAGLSERGQAIANKTSALDALWTETRDAIAELDAHIAAARDWLAARGDRSEASVPPAVAEPVVEAAPALDSEPTDAGAEPDAVMAPAEVETTEAEAVAAEAEPLSDLAPIAETEPEALAEAAPDPETTVEPAEAHAEDEVAPTDIAPASEAEPVSAAAPEAVEPAAATPSPTPVSALPHPLETRLQTLSRVRAEAIDRLPRLRAAQNADCRAPVILEEARHAVDAWREDWTNQLGLAGKRPKKVRPDVARLGEAQATLTERISAAERDLAGVQARRAELDGRTWPTPETPSLAA